MAKMRQKEMPTRATGWAPQHRSPTHTPMRPTAPPTHSHISTSHLHCQDAAADFIYAARVYRTKAYQFRACGDWRHARLCVEHAIRCLQRAHKEMQR